MELPERPTPIAVEAETQRQSFLSQLSELIAPEDIIEAGCRMGVIKRNRKIDLPALVTATITAMSPIPGTETSAFVNYLSLTGQTLAPSAFYDRFSNEFAQLMRELAQRSVRAVKEAAGESQVFAEYQQLLEIFSDIRIVDSTCLLLKRFAAPWAPSTSRKRPAQIKIHTVISMPTGVPIHGEITGQKVHDNKMFPDEALASGVLSLFDLGYTDTDRFLGASDIGAFFVSRLKGNYNPTVVRVYKGGMSKKAARGMALKDAMSQQVLGNEGKVIDIDAAFVGKESQGVLRVVATRDSDGEWHWFLTNVSRDVMDAKEIAELYRVRWNIELVFKQLKSGLGLDAILAWRPCAVAALICSKIVALCLARLLEIAVNDEIGNDKDFNKGGATQLAIVLTLSRAMPLLMSIFMMWRGVTLAQLEERILIIAKIVARSRSQRREREKRKRLQRLAEDRKAHA